MNTPATPNCDVKTLGFPNDEGATANTGISSKLNITDEIAVKVSSLLLDHPVLKSAMSKIKSDEPVGIWPVEVTVVDTLCTSAPSVSGISDMFDRSLDMTSLDNPVFGTENLRLKTGIYNNASARCIILQQFPTVFLNSFNKYYNVFALKLN